MNYCILFNSHIVYNQGIIVYGRIRRFSAVGLFLFYVY